MGKKQSREALSTTQKLSLELYFWAQALVFALIVLVLINVLLFRVSGVDGSSMYPTLEHGDQVLMRIVGYNEPEHGDVVVVVAPNFKQDPLVKRVIAVGGDTLDIDRATGTVILNGVPLDEPYINEAIAEFGSMDYPVLVPEDHVFVMGDNRNRSSDSRYVEIGMLPNEYVIGKVFLRIWPLSSIGGIE